MGSNEMFCYCFLDRTDYRLFGCLQEKSQSLGNCRRVVPENKKGDGSRAHAEELAGEWWG